MSILRTYLGIGPNTTITDNFLNYMQMDGMYMDDVWMGNDNFMPKNSSGGTGATNVYFTNNVFMNHSRAAMEFQGNSSGYTSCSVPGYSGNACDISKIWIQGIHIDGNTSFPTYYGLVFPCAYSFPMDHIMDGDYNNNSSITNSSLPQSTYGGFFMETGGHVLQQQGNVQNGTSNSGGNITYTNNLADNTLGNGTTTGATAGYFTSVNNLMCAWTGGGPSGSPPAIAGFGAEDGAGSVYDNGITPIVAPSGYNYAFQPGTSGTQCNGYPSFNSNIVPAFLSSSTSGSTKTFSFGFTSVFAIRQVVYAVDGVVIGNQTTGNVNTGFTTTPQWQYSTSLNPAAYSAGTHTLTATATDGINKTGSVSTTFSGGGAAARVQHKVGGGNRLRDV